MESQPLNPEFRNNPEMKVLISNSLALLDSGVSDIDN